MKYKFLILLLVIMSASLFAEKVDGKAGESGFKMLDILKDPATAASGGVGSFNSYNSFSFLTHPVSGLENPDHQVSFNTAELFADITAKNLGYIKSSEKMGFGLSFRTVDYGEIEKRDDNGLLIGNYEPVDMVLSTNMAFRIKPSHYAGANVHLLYERISNSSAYGLAFDLGYYYKSPIKNLCFSAALRNMGKTSKMDDEDITLPFSYEGSAIYTYQISDIVKNHSEVKFMKYRDDDNLKINIGNVVSLHDIFQIRMGYKLNYDEEDFTAGFSVKVKNYNVGYSFIKYAEELDDIHMIGVSYSF